MSILPAASPVRLGIIGYGIMGERLLRAALAHDPAAIAVAGLWDPSAAAMQRLAADLPRVRGLASAEAVIAACDCLYIASPPAFHLGYARAAIAAGRAVFCEKPLAVDLKDTQSFVAETASANGSSGARGAVNFPFTSMQGVAQLKRWMDDGRVGTVQRLSVEIGFAHWPRPWQMDAESWLDARQQGGFTREVGSHFLFLARRLFGPLVLKQHSVAYPEAGRSERTIAATMMAGNLPLQLQGGVGTTDKPDHNIFLIEGDAGAIRLRDWAVAEYRDADGNWQPAPEAMPNEKARPLVLRDQLDKVAAMTAGRPAPAGLALASFREAAEVQTVVETILAG